MGSFEVRFSISRKDYRLFLLREMYQRPIIRVVTVTGLICLLFIVFDLAGLVMMNNDVQIPSFLTGIYCLLLPMIIRIHAGSNYDKAIQLHGDMRYSFSDDGINIQNDHLNNFIPWKMIKRIKEYKSFILLYMDKRGGLIIDAKSLNPTQLKFISNKVQQPLS